VIFTLKVPRPLVPSICLLQRRIVFARSFISVKQKAHFSILAEYMSYKFGYNYNPRVKIYNNLSSCMIADDNGMA